MPCLRNTNPSKESKVVLSMKTFSIAGIELKNRYVQAPLAGYSDFAMRHMAAEKGAALVYTEMESCEALVYQSKATIQDLHFTNLDQDYRKNTKLALQIFGGKKDSVLKSIPLVEKYADYDFLDFNCGCPVPKVIRQHAGSFWLKRQDELIDLLSEMVKISSKPVIVKLRIGFEEITDMVTLCKRIENVGVKAIAIHGRTRSEGFSGPVHYDVIQDVKHHVSIPIIANGSISLQNFQQVFKETDADALMIGQNAIGYPKIFEDMIRTEENLPVKETTLDSQIEDLKHHLALIFAHQSEKKASDVMRSFSVRYLKGFDNIKEKRKYLVQCSSLQQYLDILNSMQNEQL